METLRPPFSELVAKGKSPLAIMRRVARGKRPSLPVGIAPAMHSLITRCWASEPSQRPTFEQVLAELLDDEAMLALPPPATSTPTTPAARAAAAAAAAAPTAATTAAAAAAIAAASSNSQGAGANKQGAAWQSPIHAAPPSLVDLEAGDGGAGDGGPLHEA